MPSSKVTILVNGATPNSTVVWGFSESWYFDSVNPAGLRSIGIGIASARADLLPQGCGVVGIRVTLPDGRASSEEVATTVGGLTGRAANGLVNVPQDAALQTVMLDGGRYRPKFWVHSLPDAAITNARVISSDWHPRVQQYFMAVSRLGAQYRRLVNLPALPGADSWALISNINAQGEVTLFSGLNVTVGKKVSLMHVKDVNGKAIRGNYYVGSVTDDTHFTLREWPNRVVGAVGRIRKQTYEYIGLNLPDTSVLNVLRAGSRKVGRPFGQLVGRVRRTR